MKNDGVETMKTDAFYELMQDVKKMMSAREVIIREHKQADDVVKSLKAADPNVQQKQIEKRDDLKRRLNRSQNKLCDTLRMALAYGVHPGSEKCARHLYSALRDRYEDDRILERQLVDEYQCLFPHLSHKRQRLLALECCDLAYDAYQTKATGFIDVALAVRRHVPYIQGERSRMQQINKLFKEAEAAYATRRMNLMPVAEILKDVVAQYVVRPDQQRSFMRRLDGLIEKGANIGSLNYPQDLPYLKDWISTTPKTDLQSVNHSIQRAVDAFVRNVYTNGYIPTVRDQPGPTAKAIAKDVLAPLFRKAGVLPEDSLLKVIGGKVIVVSPTMKCD